MTRFTPISHNPNSPTMVRRDLDTATRVGYVAT